KIKLAQRTIALLSSMIESGESHTTRSREMKDNALNGLEQLRIGDVVGSLPTDEQIDDKVFRVSASTWGDYGAGLIDGTRNGTQWVVDFVNGNDE
ncbi:MAG: hypothetical protein WD512_21030, partial [Candidatus Paceibacterota bacterium]